MSDSLPRLQHARLPCLSLSPKSLIKFMSIDLMRLSNHLILYRPLLLLPSIFPRSGSFPMSELFTSGGQSIRVLASASVFPMNIQDWFPLGLTRFDLLALQGTLKSLLQHHSSKASVLRHSAFFIVQLSHPYMTTGKAIALTRWTFDGKLISLLLYMLSRLVIAFIPRSKRLLISWLQSPKKIVCHCFHCFPIYLPRSDGTRWHDLSYLNVEF